MISSIVKFIKSIDKVYVILFLILSVIHIFAVYSSTAGATLDELRYGKFVPQLVYSLISIFLFFLITAFDYRWLKFRVVAGLLYILNLLFLILVFFQTPIANVHRWLTFSFIQFQPSELAKTTLAITISAILDHNQVEVFKKVQSSFKKNNIFTIIFREIKIPILLLILIGLFVFLILIQPSAGVSLLILISLALSVLMIIPHSEVYIFILVCLIIGITGHFSDLLFKFEILGLNYDFTLIIFINLIIIASLFLNKNIFRKFFLWGNLLIMLGIFIIPFWGKIWDSNLIQPYQKTRIESFFSLQDTQTHLDAKYQQDKAMQLFSNAGLFGRGYLKGTKTVYAGVPDGFTDFAYTTFIEEFGYIGGILFNLLVILLLSRILMIGGKSQDLFGRNLCICIVNFYIFSFILSVMINLGVLFNTGLATPFLSYGGTNTLLLGINFGICSSIARISKTKKTSYIP